MQGLRDSLPLSGRSHSGYGQQQGQGTVGYGKESHKECCGDTELLRFT